MTATALPTRHRPTYLLWTPSGYRSACSCHWMRPVRFDRPLPGCVPLLSRASDVAEVAS